MINPALRHNTIYIAGPMTGLPNHNYPAFHSLAARLRARGLVVVNPAELFPPEEQGQSWEYYMRRTLQALLTCNAIIVMKGSGRSRGACLELIMAKSLHFRVSHDEGQTWEIADREV